MGIKAFLADFAQDVTEGTTEIPERLQYYIDYEKMADDMTVSGDVFAIELGVEEVHVFYSNVERNGFDSVFSANRVFKKC